MSRRTAITMIMLLALPFVARWVWGLDSVQREIAPRRYWTQRVQELEELRSQAESAVLAAAYQLERLRVTSRAEFLSRVNRVVREGASLEEATRSAYDWLEEELQRRMSQLDERQIELEVVEIQLKKAREEVSQHPSLSVPAR